MSLNEQGEVTEGAVMTMIIPYGLCWGQAVLKRCQPVEDAWEVKVQPECDFKWFIDACQQGTRVWLITTDTLSPCMLRGGL